MVDMKLFNIWDTSKVEVHDLGLKDYINLDPIMVPHTGAKHTKKRFWKKKNNVVERMITKMMVTGHVKCSKKHVFTSGRNTGKKQKMYLVAKKAFQIIEKKTSKNPIQILVKAIEHSAPRGETTTVEYGGIKHPVSVDVSPQRRLDLALGMITKGSMSKSLKSRLRLEACLADELIAASTGDPKSFAVNKKDMIERQAEASR